MADIDFGNPKNEIGDSLKEEKRVDDTTQDRNTAAQETPVNENGMSLEELDDANKIKVTIADYNTPLVILFGPPACGKTMTLVRLTRYLKKKGYTIKPITSFRPSYDKNYIDMCTNFDKNINSDDAARSTAKINFMLIQVLYKGKPLCQILEGPGEYYFKPEDPNAAFPRYVNAIIASVNRKIWAIMVEPDNTNPRMDREARMNYVTKIHQLKSKISRQDKIMFIFNKIDETEFVIGPGEIKYDLALKHTDYLYPNIFVPFKNENPLTRIITPYRFDFVAFQSGTYPVAADGTKGFEPGHDVYPRKLWEFIQKRIKG